MKLVISPAKYTHHVVLAIAYLVIFIVLLFYIRAGVEMYQALRTDHDSRGMMAMMLVGLASEWGYGVSTLLCMVCILIKIFRREHFQSEQRCWYFLRVFPIGLFVLAFIAPFAFQALVLLLSSAIFRLL